MWNSTKAFPELIPFGYQFCWDPFDVEESEEDEDSRIYEYLVENCVGPCA